MKKKKKKTEKSLVSDIHINKKDTVGLYVNSSSFITISYFGGS